MRRRGRPAEPLPEFFVDRSLGGHVVADALRAEGLIVQTLVERSNNEQTHGRLRGLRQQFISDDPVRWLFADEADADDFAAAINEGRKYPEAWVSFEPIAWSLHDHDLGSAFPETAQFALGRHEKIVTWSNMFRPLAVDLSGEIRVR